MKWLLATYLVKLLGISKFTPAAVYYHIQVTEMCAFLKSLRVRKDQGKHQPQADKAMTSLLTKLSTSCYQQKANLFQWMREKTTESFAPFPLGPMASRHSQSNFKL